MFRKASLIVGTIVLIAAVRYVSSVCKAGEDVKAGPQEEREKSQTFDDEAFANPRPANVLPIGGVKRVERTIPAALIWLANHQLPDGRWSLHDYTQQCKDKTCTGQSDISSDAGATALGLLPFLGAGQTHKSKGPYRVHIRQGVDWLIRHQQPDGNLANGSAALMYNHGLATIALSEAYGLTGDSKVGMAAQKAVNFILAAQNRKDGGWRYNPRDPGDTSVLGWQLAALKSAHMAGLDVGGNVFADASKYLDSVAIRGGTEYGYQPETASSPTMTAVGLLGRQYFGAKRDNPMLTGGMKYLMHHLPDDESPNIYYWYYGTQVMHNLSGDEWLTWNHKIRDILVRSQVRDINSCAHGSWDPAKDVWGRQGGRVMTTSLATLTLEVYYRYLPIFKTGVMPSEELKRPGQPAQEAEYNDDSKLSEQPGSKPSSGFGTRGSGSRAKMLASGGGTKQSERAVTAALVWLANHQSLDGSWSLKLYTRRCVDKTCTGVSDIPADAGATAMGLLPFLAAGQTHKSKGPYKEHILKGVGWLIKHQQPDGNLGKSAQQMMYSHGLATIAISEAYGLTGDKQVGRAAQAAVNFILKAQNAADGGWRYNPGDPGDTSVLGWQLMALKSATWLDWTSVGRPSPAPASGSIRLP